MAACRRASCAKILAHLICGGVPACQTCQHFGTPDLRRSAGAPDVPKFWHTDFMATCQCARRAKSFLPLSPVSVGHPLHLRFCTGASSLQTTRGSKGTWALQPQPCCVQKKQKLCTFIFHVQVLFCPTSLSLSLNRNS